MTVLIGNCLVASFTFAVCLVLPLLIATRWSITSPSALFLHRPSAGLRFLSEAPPSWQQRAAESSSLHDDIFIHRFGVAWESIVTDSSNASILVGVSPKIRRDSRIRLGRRLRSFLVAGPARRGVEADGWNEGPIATLGEGYLRRLHGPGTVGSTEESLLEQWRRDVEQAGYGVFHRIAAHLVHVGEAPRVWSSCHKVKLVTLSASQLPCESCNGLWDVQSPLGRLSMMFHAEWHQRRQEASSGSSVAAAAALRPLEIHDCSPKPPQEAQIDVSSAPTWQYHSGGSHTALPDPEAGVIVLDLVSHDESLWRNANRTLHQWADDAAASACGTAGVALMVIPWQHAATSSSSSSDWGVVNTHAMSMHALLAERRASVIVTIDRCVGFVDALSRPSTSISANCNASDAAAANQIDEGHRTLLTLLREPTSAAFGCLYGDAALFSGMSGVCLITLRHQEERFASKSGVVRRDALKSELLSMTTALAAAAGIPSERGPLRFKSPSRTSTSVTLWNFGDSAVSVIVPALLIVIAVGTGLVLCYGISKNWTKRNRRRRAGFNSDRVVA